MSELVAEFVHDHEGWESLSGLEARCEAVLAAGAARLPDRVAGTAVILFTDDPALQAMNARFRGKDRPTNVLSFPAAAGAGYPGDIALAFETCAREAEAAGIALADHAAHLALHGFLHLNGYDHETEDEAAVMEALETAVLAEIGIADPYRVQD